MHAITKKQYLEVCDQRYTVISFDRDSKRRRSTYGGLSMVAAVREIQKMQVHGCFCILFSSSVRICVHDKPHGGWHFDDYEDLFKTIKKR